MRHLIEFLIIVGVCIALLRPKLLPFVLVFTVIEPSKMLSLGNYIVGPINVKYYEIVLALIYLGALWNQHRSPLRFINLSFLLFMACALFSLVRGVAIYQEAAFNQFRPFFAMGLCLAIPVLYRDEREVQPLLVFFFFAVIAAGLIELAELIRPSPLTAWILSDVRFTSVLSGTEGAMLAMPFIYILSNTRYIGKFHVHMLIGAIWCGVESVLSTSRGVWIGLLGSTVGIVWFMDVRRKLSIVVTAAFVIAILYVFTRGFYCQRYDMSISDRILVIADPSEGTAYWRIMAWTQMIDDIKDHPFIGVPFGDPITFYVYRLGYYQEQAPHNEFLKIARYTGLPGLFAFCWFLGTIVFSARRYMQRNLYTRQYYEMTGLLCCFVFHLITSAITQTFTDMTISSIAWSIPGIMNLYIIGGNQPARYPAAPVSAFDDE